MSLSDRFRAPVLDWAADCAVLCAVLAGLRCTTEEEPQTGVPELCEEVVACLEGPRGAAPPYASAECAATAAGLEDLAERLDDLPTPEAASGCDSLDACEQTFCRAELSTTIRQWDCRDYPVSGQCTCIALPIAAGSPSSFAVGGVCLEAGCCFALSAPTGEAGSRPVTACGCIGDFAAQGCAEAIATNPDWVQVESCPPRLSCAQEGAACDAESCCSGLSCRADAAGEPRCVSVSEAERWQESCEAVASNRAFSGLAVVAGALNTSVGQLEFDRLRYSLLDTAAGGCIRRLILSLGDDQDRSDCRLSLDVESRGADWVVTYAAGFFAGCPGYSGGLLNDSYAVGLDSGIQATFDGATCPTGDLGGFCLSGRFEFLLSGPSGSDPAQTVTFSEARIVLEGSVCGGGLLPVCEPTR